MEQQAWRILIVEDEERIAAFVTKGFTAEGYAVTTATTGTEGIALAMTGASGARSIICPTRRPASRTSSISSGVYTLEA